MNDSSRSGEYWKKYKPWKDVTSEQWNSGDWQYKHLVRTIDELAEIVPLTAEALAAGHATAEEYKFATTPYSPDMLSSNGKL